MPDRWAACRCVLARHSKSFDLAARFLPRDRRDEVAALYAWCRVCDDAVDHVPASEQPQAVDALREGLRAVYAGVPQVDPVASCFQTVAARRRIPIEYPHELLAGMAMDADASTYESVDELLVYCWRAAGTVGLMMCHVLGVSDARAARHAAHLGIAMQLTNICRDVVEDWERGRVYLPAELLPRPLAAWLAANARAPERPSLPAGARSGLAAACRELLARAEDYYASADAGMAFLQPRAALAVRTARLVYAEIGRRIEARGGDALAGRAVVPARRKLRLACRALRHYASERRRGPAPTLSAPTGVLRAPEAIRLA